MKRSTVTKNLLCLGFIFSFALFACSKTSPIYSENLSRYNEAVKKLVEENLIQKEIIEKQYEQMQKDIGLAFYDYFCYPNEANAKGFHYKYDINSVLSVLRKYAPKEDLSVLEKAQFPFVDPDIYYKSHTYQHNVLGVTDYTKWTPSLLISIDENSISGTSIEYIGAVLDTNPIFCSLGCDLRLSKEVENMDTSPYATVVKVRCESDEWFVENDNGDAAGFCIHQPSYSHKGHKEDYEVAEGETLSISYRQTKVVWGDAEIVIRQHYQDDYRDNRDFWDTLTGKEYKTIENSYFIQIFNHEFCHVLGLDDLYVKIGYNEDDYHPNTGDSIMKGINTEINFMYRLFPRDEGNLFYLYGGEYYAMLDRIDAEVRGNHAKPTSMK